MEYYFEGEFKTKCKNPFNLKKKQLRVLEKIYLYLEKRMKSIDILWRK